MKKSYQYLDLTRNIDILNEFSLKELMDSKNKYIVIYPAFLRNHPLISALKKSIHNKFIRISPALQSILLEKDLKFASSLINFYVDFLLYDKPDKKQLIAFGIKLITDKIEKWPYYYKRGRMSDQIRIIFRKVGYEKLNTALRLANHYKRYYDKLSPEFIYTHFWSYHFSINSPLIKMVLAHILLENEEYECYENAKGRLFLRKK